MVAGLGGEAVGRALDPLGLRAGLRDLGHNLSRLRELLRLELFSSQIDAGLKVQVGPLGPEGACALK